MKIFQLDGKSHSVAPEDALLLEGPGTFTGNEGDVHTLRPGDTTTMLFCKLAPGEAVVITSDVLPATTFFRNLQS